MGLWDWAFGVDQEQERANRAGNETLKALAYTKYTNGQYTLAEYQGVIARLDGDTAASLNAGAEVQAAFIEGGADGLKNISDTVQSVTNSVTGGFWQIIPWQVKVGAGLVAAFYIWQFWKATKP